MIAISSTTFDPQGVLRVDPLPGSQLGDLTRRVNRVQTLDFGVSFNNRGFSHGDRTFRIRWRLSDATDDIASHLVRTHDAVYVSTDEGVFSGFIESYTPTPTEGQMTILIQDRVST